MSRSHFDTTNHDRYTWAVVKCPCGATAERKRPRLSNTTGGDDGHIETQMLTRHFEKLGWRIGKRPADDRCPDCVSSQVTPKVTPKQEPTMSITPLPTVNQKAAPKPMSRDDGRIIFAKLEDVYRDEKHGYKSDWTDAKVAESLNCPRAWVEQVRKQFFGPEGGNDDIRAIVAEARAFLETGTKLVKDAERMVEEARTLMARRDMVERKLHAVEQGLR